MSDLLISIVVPVYKVEPYLHRCVDSIINQTYENLEIILVDDGSPDRCPAICDEYAEKDKRIKVIHKINGGQSEARNSGIQIANGEYITFIDSDDYIRKDFIEKLLFLCTQNGCQIAQCAAERGISESFSPQNSEIITEKYNYKQMFLSKKRKFTVLVWDKLYKRDLFKDVTFPVGKKFEDDYTTYKLIYLAKNIITTNEKLYYYYDNPNSTMRKKKDLLDLDFIEAYEERIQFFNSHNEELLADFSGKELCIRLMIAYISCKSNKNNKNDIKYIRKLFLEYYKKIRNKKVIPVLEKTVLLFFKLTPNVAAFFENVLGLRVKLRNRRNK